MSDQPDIFISYAHVDDDPLPGVDKGWVSTFVEALRKNLARELGRPDAFSLWMDYELRGHEPLTAAIHSQLSGAKTLVLFLSRGYLASDWCRTELGAFAAREDTETDRIFPVYVSPVQGEEIPEPIRDLPKYQFWVDEREGPRTLADPQPIPTEREYYQGIRRLARELADKLRGIAQPPAPTQGLTVFVNGGAQDIDLLRSTAASLEARGCGYMLPSAALDSGAAAARSSAEAITRELRDNLEICDAVLLLHRDSPGIQIRQYIKEYRKQKARSGAVPQHIYLCQARAEPEELGINIPELRVVCSGASCVDDCVDRFLSERSA